MTITIAMTKQEYALLLNVYWSLSLSSCIEPSCSTRKLSASY